MQIAFPRERDTDFARKKQVQLSRKDALRAQRTFRHRLQQTLPLREPMNDETGIRQAGGADQNGIGRDHRIRKEMKIRLDTSVTLP